MWRRIKHWWKWYVHTPVMHFFGWKAKTDWISAYSFMAKKMLPYLLDYQKADRCGTPCFSDTETPYNPQGTEEQMKQWDDEREARWQYILGEIIFALQYCADENDDDCMVPNPLYNPKQTEPFKDTLPDEQGLCKLEFNDDYGDIKIDSELHKAKQERVAKGLKLMGEYFRNLWD